MSSFDGFLDQYKERKLFEHIRSKTLVDTGPLLEDTCKKVGSIDEIIEDLRKMMKVFEGVEMGEEAEGLVREVTEYLRET